MKDRVPSRPPRGEPRIGFPARATVSRRGFGITLGLAADGTKVVVSDKVGIVLDLQAFFRALNPTAHYAQEM